MYSFLVLLPLTLIAATVGALVVFSPQIGEYIAYFATIEAQADRTRLPLQISVHIVSYAIACFVLVATARTVSAPVSPDRSVVLCRIQLALEAIFVAVPSGVIVARAAYAIASPPGWLFWSAAAVAAVALSAIVFTGRPRDFFRFRLALTAIVAGIPAAVLAGLLIGTVAAGGPTSWLLALAAVVAAAGLAASVAAVALLTRPLEFFRPSLRPFSLTMVDFLGGLAVAATVALVVSFKLRPVESASFLGIFPILFMTSATALIVVARIFAKGSSPVAIVSTLVSAVVVMHLVDQFLPPREFRHGSEIPAGLQPKADSLLSIRDVTKDRGIPELRAAFLEWLRYRRPAIEAYRKKGKSYPVFVVAAQGGGIYAAYHSALSLARLYDACPEFANHVFAVSGVSGGGLGAAVLTELLHSVPDRLRSNPASASEGCNPRVDASKLEDKVKAFFTADFLSPVVDSALVFDIPSLLVPWLRFGSDRAFALELAFESAWRKTGVEADAKYGLAANFYGRWKPDGPAPALFLAATGVNYGIPVLVSQIRWSQNPRFRLRGAGTAGGDEELEEVLQSMQVQDERSRDSVIANILDFRPDLQLATSTAIGLSARFPYVTPPANIRRHDKIEKPAGLYEYIKVLELLDGSFFDNSGGWVAIDILEDLERYLRARRRDDFKEFTDDIAFQLIRFTDRPAQRYGDTSEEEHFELVSPLIAFNAVRLARGAQLRGVRDLDNTKEHFIYLTDPWFRPPLNWLLSEGTKRNIQLRSGGQAKTESDVLCCKATSPPRVPRTARSRRTSPRELILVADWDSAKKLNDHPEARGLRVEKFVPNNETAFRQLLELVKEGDARESPAAQN